MTDDRELCGIGSLIMKLGEWSRVVKLE